MRFFFFGTLMDTDVLSLVIGRTVSADMLKPAHLDGFRRVCVQGASYPVIVADEDGMVDGVIMAGISPQECEALEAYEGKGYRVVTSMVDGRAERREVLMFEPVDGSFTATDEEWELAQWQRRDKARFLEGVRRWKTAGKADRDF
jgi:hypothetical protein